MTATYKTPHLAMLGKKLYRDPYRAEEQGPDNHNIPDAH
jgi:hypothetical protein